MTRRQVLCQEPGKWRFPLWCSQQWILTPPWASGFSLGDEAFGQDDLEGVFPATSILEGSDGPCTEALDNSKSLNSTDSHS